MLNTLAGYVLGRVEQKEASYPPGVAFEPSPEKRRGLSVSTRSSGSGAGAGQTNSEEAFEGDWIFLDYDDDCSLSRKSSQDNPDGLDVELCDLALQSLPVSAISSSHPSPAASGTSGWQVAPPTCFVQTCEDDTVLETSSFENLLIEHPSMSVYTWRTNPPLPRGSRTDEDLGLNDDEDVNDENLCNFDDTIDERRFYPHRLSPSHTPDRRSSASSQGSSAAEVSHRLRRPVAQRLQPLPQPQLTTSVLLRQATDGARRQQKAETKAEKPFQGGRNNSMKRANMVGSGAAVAAAGRPKSRKNKMKEFSGKNNDRKCQ